MARTDPRTLHAEGIRELLGPRCREGDTEFLDAHNAILHEYTQAAPIATYTDGQTAPGEAAIALTIGGRVNKSQDHVDVLFMTNTEGAASMLAEVVKAAHQIGGKDFVDNLLDEAMAKIKPLDKK